MSLVTLILKIPVTTSNPEYDLLVYIFIKIYVNLEKFFRSVRNL